LSKPVFKLEQEFSRDMEWMDWKHVRYTLKQEWAYVSRPARRKEGCTPGIRDSNNDGKTPEEFLSEVNSHIQECRAKGWGLELPVEHALLLLDEMKSIRLYSGPAYQPLNAFLRQIAQLSANFHAELAQHPDLSFAATVGHICRGIRKLAAVVEASEASQPLFHGVRGELPRSFWLPDEQGMVCATDTAFMSTSRQWQTPVDYMGTGPNVLWELSPSMQTDAAFHRGTDISMLSQFAAEAEVLFPPGTMLVAKARDKPEHVADTQPRQSFVEMVGNTDATENSADGGKTYVSIRAKPFFI
jgi:hypothetical protein